MDAFCFAEQKKEIRRVIQVELLRRLRLSDCQLRIINVHLNKWSMKSLTPTGPWGRRGGRVCVCMTSNARARELLPVASLLGVGSTDVSGMEAPGWASGVLQKSNKGGEK